MKLGFTGTRHGMTGQQMESLRGLLRQLAATELHHGDCLGADAEADAIARDLGMSRIIHPPDKDDLRAFCHGDDCREPLPYLERNRQIVEATAALLAAPSNDTESKWGGTWSTVRYARLQGRMVYLVFPDGTIEEKPGNAPIDTRKRS